MTDHRNDTRDYWVPRDALRHAAAVIRRRMYDRTPTAGAADEAARLRDTQRMVLAILEGAD